MRVSFPTSVSIALTAAVITGCSISEQVTSPFLASSGGTQPIKVSQIQSEPHPNIVAIPRAQWPRTHPYPLHFQGSGARGLIFNSQTNYGVLDYYKKRAGSNQRVAGSLNGAFNFPQGMTTDSSGNLYVADTGNSAVKVFAPGSSTPTQTLSDPGWEPADVAVGKDGTVYVGNILNIRNGPGSVTVYAPGSTSPTNTLTDSNFSQVIGVALDKNNNLYVSYGNASRIGTVAIYPSGSTTPRETGIAIGFPGGVQLDAGGRLLLMDQFSAMLDVFDVGNPNPIAQLPLPGDAAFFCFNPTKKRMFVSDFSNASIDVFDYSPSGLVQVNKITKGIAKYSNNIGIATTQRG